MILYDDTRFVLKYVVFFSSLQNLSDLMRCNQNHTICSCRDYIIRFLYDFLLVSYDLNLMKSEKIAVCMILLDRLI